MGEIMYIDINNFEKSNSELYDIVIIQKNVDGGATSIEEIDRIKDYPNAKSIIISGLDQKKFDYFIKTYGRQFEAIFFYKNKKVTNLSILSELENIKFINFFFNQKVINLWNMEKNINLTGLSIHDFSKLHNINLIETAPSLEYFALGNMIHTTMEIETFRPITKSTINHFSWYGNKVLDNDYICLSRSKINELDMNISKFTMEELIKIVSSFSNLKGTITNPYREISVIEKNVKTTYYYLCKGRKCLIKGKDDEKLKQYLDEYYKKLKKAITNKIQT